MEMAIDQKLFEVPAGPPAGNLTFTSEMGYRFMAAAKFIARDHRFSHLQQAFEAAAEPALKHVDEILTRRREKIEANGGKYQNAFGANNLTRIANSADYINVLTEVTQKIDEWRRLRKKQ